jgi:hypothetical protein
MNRRNDWTQLRDGVTLHAEQLLNLADDAYLAAAGVAAAVGAAGHLVAASAVPSETLNAFEFNHEGHSVELENLRILTHGGLKAFVPPPRKAFVLPPGGELPYLNVYVRDFTAGAGLTETIWESQPAVGSRGVPLVHWNGERFRLLAQPFTIGALDGVRQAFAEVFASTNTLIALLLQKNPKVGARIGLAPDEYSALGSLLQSLERVQYLSLMSPLVVARPVFFELALEVYSWFSFSAGRRSGRGAADLGADVLSRHALVRQGNLPVPDYAQNLTMRPGDGSGWIELMESLARSVFGLTRVLQGERDEDTMDPIERFEPDLYPDGLGLRFALPEAGGRMQVRCDMSHAFEPVLLWGLGGRTDSPHLRAAPVDTVQPGRYEAKIGPFNASPNQELVIVVDSADVVVSVSLTR